MGVEVCAVGGYGEVGRNMTAVKVDDKVEAAHGKLQSVCLPRDFDHVIDVRVSRKAFGKARFHENGDTKGREFFFQSADRAGEQQAVPHGAQAYKENARVWTKPVEQIASFQPWLR